MEPHQLAHATFTISGDRVMPEFWTSYFGVTPEMAIVKGECLQRRLEKQVVYLPGPAYGACGASQQSRD